MEPVNVNYISHLNGWFDKSFEDERLHSTHISLYMALFQFWNLNRFKNPMTIYREDVMKASKVGSKTTYTKCLKELHQWDYIKYEPSFNPHRGSQVHLYNFGKGTGKGSVQVVGKVNGPIYKHSKQVKHINSQVNQNKNFNEPL